MHELFGQLDRLKDAEDKVALATLVNTRGTTPRKEGAKMLVGAEGRILGSVTIGGCVDAQVIDEAEDVLGNNTPKLLELTLGDEEAWEIGLTCGGTIEVFVEPVQLDRAQVPPLSYYEILRAHAEQGGRGVLITRLDGPDYGAKLLLLDTGRTEGTLGDTFLDHRFVAEAQECLSRGVSKTLLLEGIRAFVEAFGPPATLLVVGAGHVAMPLVSLANVTGFTTIVVDGRPRFATRERFPDAHRLEVGIPSELVKSVPLTPATALVLVAHDYKYDLPVLRHALASPVGYIGMLGSRRRGAAIIDLLREEGISDEMLARIHVPIGLDLGAQSAPEIALAILAEILAERAGASGVPLSRKPTAANP
ncbi:MAG: XdhC family protein [Candidatus Methylomirabilia bacterium]